MSMPSSSDDVATSAGSRPALSSSSIATRCSRAIEPWCERTSSSPASSLSRCARRSASRRLLQNTIVEWCWRISSRIRGWIAGQMLTRASGPAAGPPGCSSSGSGSPRRERSSTGTITWSSSGLRVPASTIDDLAARSDAAEEPRDRLERTLRRREPDPLRRRTAVSFSSRSSESARCAPRLEPAIAWTSSMITCSTVRRASRAWLVSSRYSDSGVVIRMSGGRRAIWRRSSAGVSPVREAIATDATGSPSRLPASAMPARGARRLRSTSYVSALSGDT